MNNCLLIYSCDAGQGDFEKKLDVVQKALSMSFDRLDIAVPTSAYEAFETERKAIGKYHSLIVCGGDGSFNTAVNALACQKDAPILGYINEGTLGDVGKNFGVGKSLSRALKVISDGYSEPFDVGECDGHYFAYMAAYGRFSDISYAVPKHEKKRFGWLSYYKKAAHDVFEKTELSISITGEDGVLIERSVPFVLILNGTAVGGFRINKKSSHNDGIMECYVTRGKAFNGLLSFATKRRVDVIPCRKLTIKPIPDDKPWCLDGEIGPLGAVTITCHPNALRIYCRRKR